MPTSEDYLAAAERAKAAGDERATQELATAARAARQQELGAGAKRNMSEANPVVKALAGAGAAAAEPVLGLGQLGAQGLEALGLNLPSGFGSEDLAERAATVRGANAGTGAWGTAGEIATLALPSTVAAKALTKVGQTATRALPRALAGTSTRANVTSGAAGMGGYEALRPQLEGDPSRLERATLGAGLGGAGAYLPGAIARRFRAPIGEPAEDVVQTIVEAEGRGVNLPMTTGQMVSGRPDMGARMIGGLEEGLQMLPGSPTRAGRNRAALAWNQSDLRGAAEAAGEAQLGQRVAAAGDEGLRVLQRARETLYDQALSGVKFRIPNLKGFVRSGRQLQRLTSEQAAEPLQRIQNIVNDLRGGKFSSEGLKEEISSLRVAASNAHRGGQRELGEALDQIREDLLDTLRMVIGPERSQALARADRLHAQIVPREMAAKMVGARRRGISGAYTPDQLGGQIVRRAPRSTGATGRAPGQESAEAAGRAFRNSIPEVGPGTAEKLAAGGITAGVGAVTGAGAGAFPALAAMLAPYGLSGALANPAVARMLTGMTRAQQSEWARQLVRRAGSAGVAGTGAAAAESMNEY